MFKLLIFGGTTEGRLAAEFCEKSRVSCKVCVATDYGASLLPRQIKVHIGRLDREQMARFMINGDFTHILDATHPYAKEATENIRAACESVNLPYYRLIRDRAELSGDIVDSLDEAIDLMNKLDGNILCTLGSKNMAEMARVSGYKERVWLRVLPADEVLKKARNIGIDEGHVILGQGPFSVGQNIEHIRLCNAKILLTKESGSAGGYPEKIQAAKNSGIRLITLARPVENGMTLDEVKKIIERNGSE